MNTARPHRTRTHRQSGTTICESLESRRLLAVTFVDGALSITGGGVLKLTESSNNPLRANALQVSVDLNGNGVFTDPGDVFAYYTKVHSIGIKTGGGNDAISIRLGWEGYTTVKDVSVDFGAGNDHLDFRAGPSGGGFLTLSDFSLRVLGGAGDDEIQTSFDGLVHSSVLMSVDAGSDNDVVAADFSYVWWGKVSGNFQLGDGNDSFGVGFVGADHSLSGSLEMTVYGGKGDDKIGAGATVESEVHSDTGTMALNFYGQEGEDYIWTSTSQWPGQTTLQSDRTPTELFPNSDSFYGNDAIPYSKLYRGTDAADEISVCRSLVDVDGTTFEGISVTVNGFIGAGFVPAGYVRIDGMGGNDKITIAADVSANFLVNGGLGDDSISAGAGDDLLYGGDGNDRIIAANGNDTVIASGGNDTVFGGAGDDLLDGGDGHDSLFAGTGSDSVRGGPGNDLIEGGEGADTLTGGHGNDTLYGHDGNDSIEAGAGGR